jgi:hypothetical protein
MARFTTREIGRIETTYTSELATLSWTWIMKPNGKVLYRLSRINGRPERNYWRQVYELTTTERWEIGTGATKANDLLARLARERGHHLDGNHR